MRIVAADVEANGFMPLVDTVWCICFKDVVTKEKTKFVHPIDEEELYKYCSKVDKFIFHNGAGYDYHVLKKLFPSLVPLLTLDKLIDTLIISRTTDYKRMVNHSLDNWGKMLGLPKGDWKDFDVFHPKMVEYCEQDVEITCAVWGVLKKYCVGVEGAKWKDSFDLEKEVAYILSEAQSTGFAFNKEKALDLLDDVKMDMLVLEIEFQTIWPPELVVSKTIKYRKTNDGALYKNVAQALSSYPKTERRFESGEEFLDCYDYESFRPSSPKHRIEKLWDAGWKPFDKTKGHINFNKERVADETRREHYLTYGWKCNEDNLNTLPTQPLRGPLSWLSGLH